MLELVTLRYIIFFRNFDENSKCSVVSFFRRMFSIDELCMFLTLKRRPSKSSLQQILLRLRPLNSFQIGSNLLNDQLPKPLLKARVFQPLAKGLDRTVFFPLIDHKSFQMAFILSTKSSYNRKTLLFWKGKLEVTNK